MWDQFVLKLAHRYLELTQTNARKEKIVVYQVCSLPLSMDLEERD